MGLAVGAGVLVLLAVLLLAHLRLKTTASQRGAILQLRWLGSWLEFDTTMRRLGFYLLGWRVFCRVLGAPAPKPIPKPMQSKTTVAWNKLVEERQNLRRMGRYLWHHLHVERLHLRMQLATPDPVMTGQLYGLYAGLRRITAPFYDLHDVRVEPNFLQDWPSGWLELTLRTRLIHLLVLGIRGWWLVKRLQVPRKRQVMRGIHAPA